MIKHQLNFFLCNTTMPGILNNTKNIEETDFIFRYLSSKFGKYLFLLKKIIVV